VRKRIQKCGLPPRLALVTEQLDRHKRPIGHSRANQKHLSRYTIYHSITPLGDSSHCGLARYQAIGSLIFLAASLSLGAGGFFRCGHSPPFLANHWRLAGMPASTQDLSSASEKSRFAPIL